MKSLSSTERAADEPSSTDPASHSSAACSPPSVAEKPAGVSWPALMQSAHKSRLAKKLTRTMMGTIERWRLVEPDDRILVAISGGKDSYTLLDLLWEAKRKAPFAFEVIAVHLDQVQPGYDGRALVSWLEKSGIPFEILQEDTYSIVRDNTREGQAYCFLCARLRRGILYAAAARLRCNKIALGHHRDDSIETFLLNLFYAGKLQAMPAVYRTDDDQFDVIRPLIDCAEAEIRQFSVEREYPILPCNLCGSQEGLKRDFVAGMLENLEKTMPDVRRVMHHALANVRPTHLLDQELLHAWKSAGVDAAPASNIGAPPAPRKMTGTIVGRGGRLPLLGNDDA